MGIKTLLISPKYRPTYDGIATKTDANSQRIVRYLMFRGVAASRFLGRQELVAYKVLVLTLGSMITIPMVWSM